jgi:hypothetical protein
VCHFSLQGKLLLPLYNRARLTILFRVTAKIIEGLARRARSRDHSAHGFVPRRIALKWCLLDTWLSWNAFPYSKVETVHGQRWNADKVDIGRPEISKHHSGSACNFREASSLFRGARENATFARASVCLQLLQFWIKIADWGWSFSIKSDPTNIKRRRKKNTPFDPCYFSLIWTCSLCAVLINTELLADTCMVVRGFVSIKVELR